MRHVVRYIILKTYTSKLLKYWMGVSNSRRSTRILFLDESELSKDHWFHSSDTYRTPITSTVNFFLSHCTRVCTTHTSTATCLMTKRPLRKIRKKSISIAKPVTVQTKHYAPSNDPPWQSLPLSSINFKHESGVPENSGKSPVLQTMVPLPLPTCMSLMAPWRQDYLTCLCNSGPSQKWYTDAHIALH